MDMLQRYIDGTVPDSSGVWVPDRLHAQSLLADPAHARISSDEATSIAPQDTFLWRLYMECLQAYYGSAWKWLPQFQHYGTCGGQSTKNALDIIATLNSMLYAHQFPGRFSVAGAYATARDYIAKQPGAWQGCAGSWLAGAVVKYGGLLLKDAGLQDDSREPDENLALQLTRTGTIPDTLLTAEKQRPVSRAPNVGSCVEAAAFIQSGCPFIVGTNYIPTGKRDTDGYSRVRYSSTGHLTVIWGVRYNSQGQPQGFNYLQSWGLASDTGWGTGPVWPDDQPQPTCWVGVTDMARMIAQGDAWALCGIKGLQLDSLIV